MLLTTHQQAPTYLIIPLGMPLEDMMGSEINCNSGTEALIHGEKDVTTHNLLQSQELSQ